MVPRGILGLRHDGRWTGRVSNLISRQPAWATKEDRKSKTGVERERGREVSLQALNSLSIDYGGKKN